MDGHPIMFAHDDNQQLRRLGNVRYITRGLVITVTSLYDYLRHNYRISMFPLHIMVVNPLRYLYQRIQRRFPYSSDQLWHFTDNMVDRVIAPPLEAYTPQFIRQPFYDWWIRLRIRGMITAAFAEHGRPLEAAHYMFQQLKQIVIEIIAKVWVHLTNNYPMILAGSYVVIPPLAFFSNGYNTFIRMRYHEYPLVRRLPILPISELAMYVNMERHTSTIVQQTISLTAILQTIGFLLTISTQILLD